MDKGANWLNCDYNYMVFSVSEVNPHTTNKFNQEKPCLDSHNETFFKEWGLLESIPPTVANRKRYREIVFQGEEAYYDSLTLCGPLFFLFSQTMSVDVDNKLIIRWLEANETIKWLTNAEEQAKKPGNFKRWLHNTFAQGFSTENLELHPETGRVDA